MVFRFFKEGYQKVKESIAKTGWAIGDRVRSLFGGRVDDETLDSLEELFFEADLGVKTSLELVDKVRKLLQQKPGVTGEEVLEEIRQDLTATLTTGSSGPEVPLAEGHPLVILVVGTNGNGKTTSVAKLAHRFKEEGKKVLVVAADTFRAAAAEQLDLWSKKVGCDLVKGQLNSDPAAVAFDAVTRAVNRGYDVVIVDTAGRLHTKTPLMQELEKIRRACSKVCPGSPQETLLVLDVSIGQNAIDQAHTFNQYTPVTGLILTKLDGTARGGVVVAIHRDLGVPIRFVGLGEGMEDLQPFDSQAFVEALFS